MGLPKFYEVEVNEKTVVDITKQIVEHHQKSLEKTIGSSLGDVVVNSFNENSSFGILSNVKPSLMRSYSMFGLIQVTTDKFAIGDKDFSSTFAFQRSFLTEYITLHELSHIAFAKIHDLSNLYLSLQLMRASDSSIESEHLQEGFANALAAGYLENYYASENTSLKTNDILYKLLPDMIVACNSQHYFKKLLSTFRKESFTEFVSLTEELGTTIVDTYGSSDFRTFNTKKKSIVSDAKQLSFNF